MGQLPNGVILAGPVEGLDGACALGPCVLGHPGPHPGDMPLVLGAGTVVRAFAVLYQGAVLGDRVQVGHGALVREGNTVGNDASIGSGAHLEPGNRIGAGSRIHSGAFLSNTTLGNNVFCGPHVVFTDDPHPPCPRYLDCVRGAVVEDDAVLGAGAVVLPGIVIEARALVAAGSVVTRSVAAGTIVAGNPARHVGERDGLLCHAGLFPHAYAWTAGPARVR